MISILFITAFLVSAGVSWLARHAGVLDHPNARSSHSRPTPRGGGLGLLAALGIALCPTLHPDLGVNALAVGMAALGFGVLGLTDDLLALGTRLKFAIILSLGAAITLVTGPVEAIAVADTIGIALPYIVGFAGSVLWIFTVSNAANFMDGSDGLTIACFLPASLTLMVLGDGEVALAGLGLAAGLTGFAVFNVPRASLFLGDVGSLSLGAIYGAVALSAIESGFDVWLYPLLILPVLADVLLTLVGKLRNRIGFLAPHRTHAYQLLIRMGWPHWQVALTYLGLSSACAGLVIMAGPAGWLNPAFAFWGAVIVITILHSAVRRMARRAGIDFAN
ncbi:glycosyltransferase family 4 protein [Hyphobacterium sp.]|uniref:glycosyltransferase family 4 protein n=1 Tax=Hyphobacterium sp. TaxID=2004662 RepID=UPI003B52FD0D